MAKVKILKRLLQKLKNRIKTTKSVAKKRQLKASALRVERQIQKNQKNMFNDMMGGKSMKERSWGLGDD